MTLENLTETELATRQNIEQLLINDTKVKVAAVDIDGVLCGKVINKTKFLQVIDNGFGFCSILFGWDILDKPYTTNVAFSNNEAQFSDLIAKVDLTSFRRIPWEDSIPFFLVYIVDPSTLQPLYCCPRTLLKQAVDDLNEAGYTAYAGIEFEFFCYKESPTSLVEKKHTDLTHLTVGMCGYSMLRPTQNQAFYYHAFDWLKQFNVEMESWHTETGPGVFEAAVAYRDAKEAGDRATLFKTAMKQIGLQHGMITSFMAKPNQDLPGCSGHMHFSLKKNVDGKNAFAVWNDDEQQKSPLPHMSITMVQFLAGVLRGLPSILAILAPTVNSYKRLVENFWAPVSVSFGIDNRLGAIRVIVPPTTSKDATRMEMRVSGADINPHLAMAAILKCGYWGIKTNQALPVDAMDASAPSKGQRLARTLQEAVSVMEEKSSIARLVLGDVFVDHYVKTRLHEWNQWQNAVTDYERKRYLELV
ncbi:unnamed protein product [Absidia cylindrospora]